jgi:hypothetical protein
MCHGGKINILLQQTVTHELSTIVENTLKLGASNFKNYLLLLDKSTDVSYTAQLAVIVHGVNKDFNITKEMVDLVPLRHHKSQ